MYAPLLFEQFIITNTPRTQLNLINFQNPLFGSWNSRFRGRSRTNCPSSVFPDLRLLELHMIPICKCILWYILYIRSIYIYIYIYICIISHKNTLSSQSQEKRINRRFIVFLLVSQSPYYDQTFVYLNTLLHTHTHTHHVQWGAGLRQHFM